MRSTWVLFLARESTSHEIDHVKAFEGDFTGSKLIALEIEWNNKDPFFDRDLENFKRLHADGAISLCLRSATGIFRGLRIREAQDRARPATVVSL